MKNAANSRLAQLRMQTRNAHENIETVPALHRLLEPDLSMPEYISVLQHMHSYLANFEPTIAAALEGWPEASLLDGARPRALLADLAFLEAGPIHGPTRLPPLNSRAAALGALYVVEGSSLGGRVIARLLQSSLGVTLLCGGRFYGEQNADSARQRWGTVCNYINYDAPGTTPDMAQADTDAAILAARATFRSLELWMRRIKIMPPFQKAPRFTRALFAVEQPAT